jgi:hypothetical protein
MIVFEKDEMGRTSASRGKNKLYVLLFGHKAEGNTLFIKPRRRWKKLYIKTDIKYLRWGLYSFNSRSFCEHHNEPSDSITSGGLLD